MSRFALGAALAALLCGGVVLGGGYVIGKAGTADRTDAEKARSDARRQAIKRDETLAGRAVVRIRQRAAEQSTRRGQVAGAKAGRVRGEQDIAARGAGPTPVPEATLPTDLYNQPPSGYVARPAEISLGRVVLENINWTSWGEGASGTGEWVGSDCEPSCAEGSVVRKGVTLKAGDPSFKDDGTRYFTTLVITYPDGQRADIDINPYPSVP